MCKSDVDAIKQQEISYLGSQPVSLSELLAVLSSNRGWSYFVYPSVVMGRKVVKLVLMHDRYAHYVLVSPFVTDYNMGKTYLDEQGWAAGGDSAGEQHCIHMRKIIIDSADFATQFGPAFVHNKDGEGLYNERFMHECEQIKTMLDDLEEAIVTGVPL